MISFSLWSLASFLTVFNSQVPHGAGGGGTASGKSPRVFFGAAQNHPLILPSFSWSSKAFRITSSRYSSHCVGLKDLSGSRKSAGAKSLSEPLMPATIPSLPFNWPPMIFFVFSSILLRIALPKASTKSCRDAPRCPLCNWFISSSVSHRFWCATPASLNALLASLTICWYAPFMISLS